MFQDASFGALLCSRVACSVRGLLGKLWNIVTPRYPFVQTTSCPKDLMLLPHLFRAQSVVRIVMGVLAVVWGVLTVKGISCVAVHLGRLKVCGVLHGFLNAEHPNLWGLVRGGL